MNSNRKFDVLLDGKVLFHTMKLNAFVLTPTAQIERVSAQKEQKYQLLVAIFDVWYINFWLQFLMSGTSTLSLLKVPYNSLSYTPCPYFRMLR